MLAIRLQRIGRKGYPMYRVAVQEAHRHPSSGCVVAYVGSFNPHTKETTLNTEKLEFYLENGAQPTLRVVKILSEQKVKLPDWVVRHTGDKKAAIKKADKLRKNLSSQTSDEVSADEPAETPADEAAPTEEAVDQSTDTDTTTEAPAEEQTGEDESKA